MIIEDTEKAIIVKNFFSHNEKWVRDWAQYEYNYLMKNLEDWKQIHEEEWLE